MRSAYAAGADAQLQWSVDYLTFTHPDGALIADNLKTAACPRPPSLKQRALDELDMIMDELHAETGSGFTASAILQALETLPND